MKNIQELWQAFEGLEIFEEPFTEKITICSDLLKICEDKDTENEIKLEMDLILFYDKMFMRFRNLENEERLEDFTYEVQDFIEKHKITDFQYYHSRYLDSLNQSDKMRYALICWFYFKDIRYIDPVFTILSEYIINYLERGNNNYKGIFRLTCFLFNICNMYFKYDIITIFLIRDISYFLGYDLHRTNSNIELKTQVAELISKVDKILAEIII